MIRFRVYVVSVLVLLLVACQTTVYVEVPVTSEPDAPIETLDFATSNADFGRGLALFGTKLYVVGETGGSLDGDNLGRDDAILRQYNGGKVWGKQFGSRSSDYVTAVKMDSSGNVYVLGTTRGAIGFALGDDWRADNFLIKYNTNGNIIWIRQFGTKLLDYATDLAIDSNNRIYTLSYEGDDALGRGNQFVMRKFNTAGTVLATRTYTNDNLPVLRPRALTVDSLSNVIVLTDWDNSAAGRGKAIRLFKFDSDLKTLWIKSFDSIYDERAYDVTTDSNDNIYFTRQQGPSSALNGGFSKYSAAGVNTVNISLDPAIGTDTIPYSITTDSANQVYIAGSTTGSYPGFSNAGETDIVVFKFNPAGVQRWVSQFDLNNNGSPSSERAVDIVVGSSIYITGYTLGNLLTGSATSFGSYDAYVAMLNKANGTILGVDQ